MGVTAQWRTVEYGVRRRLYRGKTSTWRRWSIGIQTADLCDDSQAAEKTDLEGLMNIYIYIYICRPTRKRLGSLACWADRRMWRVSWRHMASYYIKWHRWLYDARSGEEIYDRLFGHGAHVNRDSSVQQQYTRGLNMFIYRFLSDINANRLQS